MFKVTHYHKRAVSIVLAAGVILLATAYPGMAQVAPFLGAAESFAVLGDQTVTNTGPTVVDGDLGVSPGTAVVGFPPGTVTGSIFTGPNSQAAEAQADAEAAFGALDQPCDENTDAVVDIGGLTFTPGVYCFDAILLTGTVTLDAQGDPNAVFIFKTDSTITTASDSSVELVNGANPCNVFFRVGSSATLGTGTDFVGTIIARASVTLNTGADITSGRAIALDAAVTLDTNNVSVVPCGVPTPPGPNPPGPNPPGPNPPVPNPPVPNPPGQQQPAAPITQDFEQESESGDIEQTFEVS